MMISILVPAYAYASTSGIRITYNGVADTIINANSWKVKEISETEDIVIKVIEFIPIIGSVPALQEGDYLSAALSLVPESSHFKWKNRCTSNTIRIQSSYN